MLLFGKNYQLQNGNVNIVMKQVEECGGTDKVSVVFAPVYTPPVNLVSLLARRTSVVY